MSAQLFSAVKGLQLVVSSPVDSDGSPRDDLIGIKVWYSITNANFDPTIPGQATLAYSGDGLNVFIPDLTPSITYYVKYALISFLDTDNYAISNALTGTPTIGPATVALTTTAQAFAYASDGTTPTPANATITATAQNTTGTVYFEFILAGTTVQNTTSNTYTYSPQANYGSMPQQIVVKVREGTNNSTVLAQDTLSLFGIKPGTNSISGFLTNEAAVVAAANDGTVTSFIGTEGTFKVYNGTTDVTTASTAFSVVGTPTGITIAINSIGAYSISALSVDSTTATLRAVYNNVTIDKVYSISKSKTGAQGAQGPEGVRGSVNKYLDITPGTTWSDTSANNYFTTTYGTKILNDTLTEFNPTQNFSQTRFWNGSEWAVVTQVIDGNLVVSGTIGAAKISANAVTADKIAAGSITADKLSATTALVNQSLTVGNPVVTDTTITSGSGAVITGGSSNASNTVAFGNSTANIVVKDGVIALNGDIVGTSNIKTNAITSEKIVSDAITSEKIVSDAITSVKIATDAITSVKIATDAITSVKIATDAITSVKIANDAVTADKIITNAVTADKINANAVTAAKIEANAVTAAKIEANAVTADKISAGSITADKLSSNTILVNQSLTVGNPVVTGTTITSGSGAVITGGSSNASNTVAFGNSTANIVVKDGVVALNGKLVSSNNANFGVIQSISQIKYLYGITSPAAPDEDFDTQGYNGENFVNGFELSSIANDGTKARPIVTIPGNTDATKSYRVNLKFTLTMEISQHLFTGVYGILVYRTNIGDGYAPVDSLRFKHTLGINPPVGTVHVFKKYIYGGIDAEWGKETKDIVVDILESTDDAANSLYPGYTAIQHGKTYSYHIYFFSMQYGQDRVTVQTNNFTYYNGGDTVIPIPHLGLYDIKYGYIVRGPGLPSTYFRRTPTLAANSEYLRFNTSTDLNIGMTVSGRRIPKRSAIYTKPNSTEINLATFDGSGFGRDTSYVPIIPISNSDWDKVFFGPPLIRSINNVTISIWGQFSIPWQSTITIEPQLYGGKVGAISYPSGIIETIVYYI